MRAQGSGGRAQQQSAGASIFAALHTKAGGSPLQPWQHASQADPPDVAVSVGGRQQWPQLWRRKGDILHRQAALLQQRCQAPAAVAARRLGPDRNAAVGCAAGHHAAKLGGRPRQASEPQAALDCQRGLQGPGLGRALAALPHAQAARRVDDCHAGVRLVVGHRYCARIKRGAAHRRHGRGCVLCLHSR